MPIFSCNQLHKTYQTSWLKRSGHNALNGVSLQVESNEVFGIIGLNGAGKSSLLKIFMGFIRPDKGTATIAGHSVTTPDCHRLIGYLPEHPSLYPHLSIREHLRFGCRVAGLSKKEGLKRIQSALETVDLTQVADKPIKSFSKGMTQRAALAYTILLKPEILILDEPMSGLDPLGRQLVLDIIEEYHHSRKATILFCSHILTDVERICDRIGIMHQGQLKDVITPSSLSINYGNSEARSSKTPLEQYFLQTVKA